MKKRLTEKIELSEAQQRNIKRNRLLVYPILTIAIAVVTLLPLLPSIRNEQAPTLLMLIPAVFGIFLFYRGISMLIKNRKDMAAFISKKDREPPK
jgi:uncharacterized protein YacL